MDNDGRMDLVVGGSSGKDSKTDITIYRNVTKSSGRYLKIEPRMPAPNPYAAGAVVEAFAAGEIGKQDARPYFMEKAHADATPVHVGLGDRDSCDVRVTFPGAETVMGRGVAANQTVTIDAESGKVLTHR